VYRGFLLSFFQRIFNNPILSISLSAVLFGVSHYPSFHNIDQVVFASILGFIFGYLRLKEPEKFTLFSLSLAHFLHNAVLQNILYA
jgi:membrane protease YdiL (CAAX protease family)